MISYYVDPGAGFVFVQNSGLVWGLLLAMAGGFLVFFRFFFRFFKWLAVLGIIILAIFIGGALINKHLNYQRVVILGIDAMDPALTEQLLNDGRLPNLAALKNSGGYSRLETTVPAETVVAFTSIATGVNPGKHGIFDFIMRDPRDHMPFLSLTEVSNTQTGVHITNRRKAPAFWEVLSRRRIPSRVFFFPNTFPPDKIKGAMLSGMGVPDITGTMGRFSYYSFDPEPEGMESRGRHVRVAEKNGVIASNLYGPKVKRFGREDESRVAFSLTAGDKPDEMVMKTGSSTCVLKKGQWSAWQKVEFGIGFFRKARGTVRFYLASTGNSLRLYASAINFDPEKPLFAISYPVTYSRNVALRDGLYATLGMPHDTWGLQEGKLSEDAFLEQIEQILESRRRILESELKKFRNGVFFFYFDTLDIIQHMFYRYGDALSPSFEDTARFRGIINAYYEKIDSIAGEVLRTVPADTTVMVLSDHGFSPFRRQVHLNRWLEMNGFLALKPGADESDSMFEAVDWSRTKAYAVGFGGIYINKIGRDFYGIVPEDFAPALARELSARLEGFKDPSNGQSVVRTVYASSDVYTGACSDSAPDLYAGFQPGYRASWQTALGGVPAGLVEDNKRKWSGDHLVDPASVPGVLFSSKKILKMNPSVVDIAPGIYALFGLHEPGMDGKNLFGREDAVK